MKYSIKYSFAKFAKKIGINFNPDSCSAVRDMKKEISALPDGIQFTITRDPNGDWMAESVNISGIITGGNAKDDVNEMIKDAIFTYYGVPPEYCDDRLLRESSEPVVVKQSLYATA